MRLQSRRPPLLRFLLIFFHAISALLAFDFSLRNARREFLHFSCAPAGSWLPLESFQ